jgi:U3 small nucleolar RNA-associated protein 14
MIGGDGEEIGEDDDTLEGLEGGDSAEQRREYLRAQERMLLKHKNTSRWAKRAIRKGLAHLPGTKEAIAEQLRLGQELRRKIGIGGEGGGGGGGEDDEANSDSETDASDSDDDDAAPLDATQARRKQLAKAKTLTLKALEQGEQDTEEQGGLFALPFMAKALRKKREAAENEAKALLEDIENAEREAARGDADVSDDDETNKNAAGDWGATARGFEEPSRTEEDAGPVTRRAFGGVSTKRQTRAAKVIETKEEEDDDDDDKETDIGTELTENDTAQPKLPRGASRAAARAAAAGASGATQAPDLPAKPLETPRELPRGAGAAKARHAARQAGRAGMVAVGDDDDDAVAIYATAGGDAFEENDEDDPLDDTNEQLLARAFAGDDVVANFETEKTNEVESELPKTEVQKLMPGWGGWAEEQAKRPVPKWQIESEKKAAVEKAKALKARKDADLKKVIISEKYDKKAAAFNVEHLPHGFESKQVYEGQMRHPLGGDVNTDKSFRDLTRPKVLKNAGAVIRPMPAPKKRKVGK